MLKKMKFGLLLVVIITGISMTYRFNGNDKLFEIAKNIEIFVNAYKELHSNYVDELDPSALVKTGLDAMVASLDPYTNFYSESQIQSYRLSDDSKYQGVGAGVQVIGEKIIFTEILEGGPAHAEGIRAGDELLSVNGTPVTGKNAEELNNLIRGVAGTPVKLNLRKPNAKSSQELTLTRGEVNIPNVPYSGIVRDGIGYIALTTFTENAAANISKAFKELKSENPELKGIILDLRDNGGGLLREAVSISNLFIPKGVEVVTTKGKIKEKDQSFKTMSVPEDLDIPVAVLINERSASASEIVSGVLQDLDRAVLIGQRSYGKGLVQNFFELGYNNRMKITTSKYYIPSGRCIQGVAYENGEPVNIPDEKRSKFKTKNGRTVLDGGGVTPDIRIDAKEKSELTKALLDQNMIFEYATQYVLTKDSLRSVDDFKFTDYDGFLAFLKTKKFDFKIKGEAELETIQKQYQSPVATSPIDLELKNLQAKMQGMKEKAYTENKREIVLEIEKELIGRYFFQKGKTKLRLSRDQEIDEAISLLTDKKRYQDILKN
jgi:carboxyl-terminal processing protease